jgi:endonuclease/exonuclease/phosphatase family metal-dependent hydrolase
MRPLLPAWLLPAWLLLVGVSRVAAEAELTVISYNIRHGLGMDGKVDVPRIAEVIRASGARVALLQEVDRGMGRTQRRDLTAELAQALGWKGVFDANLRTADGGQYGNALLSALPIKAWKNQVYAQTRPGEPRGLLRATLTWEGREIDLLTTHLDATKDDAERKHQVALVREALLGLPAERPFILAGDFNALPGSSTLQPLRERWTDAWPALEQTEGPTFPSDRPRDRIDYFWYDAGRLRLARIRIPETQASDHRPLVATFRLGAARPDGK